MARSDASIFGDFSGRIGNVIVYKLNGKTVMRIRPAGRTKKTTPVQKQNREDFAHVMKFMQNLKPVLNTGFYDVTKGRFAFHSAFSANLKAYKEAGRPAGPEWLKLSEGTRNGAENPQVEPLGKARFRISWGEPSIAGWWAGNDRVFVVAFFIGERNYYSESRYALRSQGEVVMEVIQASPGDTIHFFLFFQDVEGSLRKRNPRNVSSSQWIAKVVLPAQSSQ
jgi:hypothetical protein